MGQWVTASCGFGVEIDTESLIACEKLNMTDLLPEQHQKKRKLSARKYDALFDSDVGFADELTERVEEETGGIITIAHDYPYGDCDASEITDYTYFLCMPSTLIEGCTVSEAVTKLSSADVTTFKQKCVELFGAGDWEPRFQVFSHYG